MDIRIRKATADDFKTIWPIFQAIVSTGETYPYATTTTQEQGEQIWMNSPMATYLAEFEGKTLGTYYIKPNQPSRGAHICNCGYMVATEARNHGLATTLCRHSQRVAVKSGFLAMQFNLVVSTNTAAVHLWEKLGFAISGTVPKAFDHARLGLVDAHIMYKHLIADS